MNESLTQRVLNFHRMECIKEGTRLGDGNDGSVVSSSTMRAKMISLLADLRHYAAAEWIFFNEILGLSEQLYYKEVREEGGEPEGEVEVTFDMMVDHLPLPRRSG